MKRLLTYSIAIALFFTFSCQKEHAPDCFTANGADVSDIRNLGSFNSIELNSNMDLTIFSGTEFKVEVIGGEKAEKEFGDILFSLINYARFLNINPEDALEQTNKKFIKRFGYMESKVKEQGKQIADCKLEELDKYWNEAKQL